jgi:hypothetical protein
MLRRYRVIAAVLVVLCGTSIYCRAQEGGSGNLPVSVSVYDRTRADAWQWFATPPDTTTYGYVESLVRVGVAQRVNHWDWQIEVAQPTVLGLPDHAVSAVTAQGQLGLGATYVASNSTPTPVAAFLKQGYVRYRASDEDKSLRVGRFEFIEGQETNPANATVAWLETNRVANRLIGNFSFSNAERSFDGMDGHYGAGTWDMTAMAARADQGVFNMNGNPELNVDLQYLALTKSALGQHLLVRVFGIGYHDGREVTKTDNRALAVRAADHGNIRIGTYGGDVIAAIPAGSGQFDFVFWGALQNGSWGALGHSANAVDVEGGYKPRKAPAAPWLRAGWFRGSGDNNPTDGKHNTFFQILPTPRVYARDPFYNLMNSTDEFVQVMEKPVRKLALRGDLHWLQLTSANDLWYSGGGAYDNKVFGYTGRPANGFSSLASIADISADYQATSWLALNFYYARPWGKSVVGAIYPAGRNSQYGYVELVYRWDKAQRGTTK